jgi:hypothetical protein
MKERGFMCQTIRKLLSEDTFCSAAMIQQWPSALSSSKPKT